VTETTTGRRRLIDRFFVRGVADEVELVNSRMLGVGISGPGVRGLKWRPGQQIRVQVGETGMFGALRTYSVWDYDGERLQLRVYLHGTGPGAEWARRVRPGSDVVFMPPRGEFTLRPAPYHLFVGEDTASVAIGAMLRDLAEPVYGVVETDEPEHRLDLPLPAVHRHGASAAESALLVDAVGALDLPDHPGIAYVAGEARTCQAVRRHLVVDRGWPRRSVVVKPFWTPGRRGMD
jgi:NADPH-dependent ferric siderophore reductase